MRFNCISLTVYLPIKIFNKGHFLLVFEPARILKLALEPAYIFKLVLEAPCFSFFKDIRAFQNDRSFPIFACKDENGILKMDKQEIMDRWKQYFADLMKTVTTLTTKFKKYKP